MVPTLEDYKAWWESEKEERERLEAELAALKGKREGVTELNEARLREFAGNLRAMGESGPPHPLLFNAADALEACASQGEALAAAQRRLRQVTESGTHTEAVSIANRAIREVASLSDISGADKEPDGRTP